AVYGVHGSPLAIAGERGDCVIIDTGDDDRQMEWLARGVAIRLGGVGHIAEYAMSGDEVRRTAIPRTMSMALSLGRAIREAREQKRSPFDALAEALSTTLYSHMRELFVGKVVDVERRTTDGFAKGHARFAPLDAGDEAVKPRWWPPTRHPRSCIRVAIVPDLICVVDAETAEPITTEGLRYGQRVRVLGISTPALMRTPEALAAFGPRAFGLSDEFFAVEAR
ncbi:DUF917 domain-containing protein, partial [Mycobacterium avium]|uniref:DUF917 domain-containing protein n=1 Tax=Mycobacterium avium TaxID=1764 RepID=UPI000B0EE928